MKHAEIMQHNHTSTTNVKKINLIPDQLNVDHRSFEKH
jgi:hypothetical protein